MRRTLLVSLVIGTSLAMFAQADSPKPAYDFSLPREERIKLAESAAPPEISGKATVYVLERTGYVKVREGTNGFSCFVDRQDPLNLEPTCFDSEGSATTLQSRLYAEQQRAAGKSEEQIKAEIEQGYKSGKFRAPQKPGIVYMMSDLGYLLNPATHQLVHLPPHLMFYAPYATEADIGSPPPSKSMPRLIRAGQPDAVMIVIPGK
ncbi:MAG: hypothetical protein LAO03_08460 [Acidobacteriia bacterium]|nr:hypothetical protein [Terriglobia bacterium]